MTPSGARPRTPRRAGPSLRWLRARGAFYADAEFFLDCHTRIDAMLQRGIAFWKRAVDWENGGFFGLVDYAGQPRKDADKHVVQQFRHLLTFSQVYRTEGGSDEIRAICDHQLDFVRERFRATDRDGLYLTVAADGTAGGGSVHLYHLAFGILGFAEYALAFQSRERGKVSLDLAKALFERIVERAYDPATGFDETLYDDRWTPHAKEINTQMHLMEAIAALLEAARAHGDPAAPTIEAVLDRQVTLIATKAILRHRRRYFCARGYGRDWSLVDDHECDFGHDIETVYLLIEAARTLGREREAAVTGPAARLGKSVTKIAYEPRLGRWLYSGNPLTGEVVQRASIVWVNFEALNGLATLVDLTGDLAYLDKLERVLAWVETKQANAAVGEWYYSVDDEGRPVDHDVFGNDCAWMSFAWKSSYHTLRALMTRKRWLEHTFGVGAEEK